MAAFELDREALRQPLHILLLVAGLMIVLYWGGSEFARQHRTQLEQTRQQLATVSVDYRLAVKAGHFMQHARNRFDDLSELGFIGKERRLRWIEALRYAGNQQHLFNLQYNLQPQTPLNLNGNEQVRRYQLYASTMEIRLEMLHEVNLIDFFSQLDALHPAVYGVRGCSLVPAMSDATPEQGKANVNAICQLSWYSARPSAGELSGDDAL